MKFNQEKVLTTDDVCPSSLKYWKYWNKVKEKYPKLRIIAFVIANYQNKENVAKNEEFRKWFEKTKDWVEIGVHGWDHLSPPECERDDQQELILKALKMLHPFLPKKFLYRPPGFQTSIGTEAILKNLGFEGIAHQRRIKYFDGTYAIPFNSHLSEDKYHNPIGQIWSVL